MANNHKVSIAMPVFNGERTIAMAVSSILNQTYCDWELLIIDDGSTDRTGYEVSCFRDGRIRWLENRDNKRLAARLNEAIGLATGYYFARMDADDISYPDRIQRQVEYLRQHPETDLVGGSICMFVDEGKLIGLRPARESHEQICGGMLRSYALAHVTWMGRTSWFRQYQYDAGKHRAEDRDLLVRSHRNSTFAALRGVLVGVRDKPLSFVSTLQGRAEFAASLLTDCVKNRDLVSVATACCELTKLAPDLVAVLTGLNHRLLKHRARPFQPADEIEWNRVWRSVANVAGRHSASVGRA